MFSRENISTNWLFTEYRKYSMSWECIFSLDEMMSVSVLWVWMNSFIFLVPRMRTAIATLNQGFQTFKGAFMLMLLLWKVMKLQTPLYSLNVNLEFLCINFLASVFESVQIVQMFVVFCGDKSKRLILMSQVTDNSLKSWHTLCSSSSSIHNGIKTHSYLFLTVLCFTSGNKILLHIIYMGI